MSREQKPGPLTNNGRVLAQLRRGPLSPIAFQHPTVDGQAPIMRVAARINDLRNDGYGIDTTQVRPTAIYELKSSPATPPPAPVAVEQAQPSSVGIAAALSTLPAPRSPHDLDDEDEFEVAA